MGFPGGWVVKNSPANARDARRRCRFDPWVEKIPWRKKWQPTPVFLLGESHGQRSLAGHCPWGRKKIRHSWAHTCMHTVRCVHWDWVRRGESSQGAGAQGQVRGHSDDTGKRVREKTAWKSGRYTQTLLEEPEWDARVKEKIGWSTVNTVVKLPTFNLNGTNGFNQCLESHKDELHFGIQIHNH